MSFNSLAGLAFTKGYSSLEMMVFWAGAITILCLLGLLSNAILGARGMGIFGNAAVLGFGSYLAFLFHNFLVRQPTFQSFNLPNAPVILSLLMLWMIIALLLVASIKRSFFS
ncbi:MAG: hypothetical protein ABWZ80_06705 [Beijerinckiaceae bacterium]